MIVHKKEEIEETEIESVITARTESAVEEIEGTEIKAEIEIETEIEEIKTETEIETDHVVATASVSEGPRKMIALTLKLPRRLPLPKKVQVLSDLSLLPGIEKSLQKVILLLLLFINSFFGEMGVLLLLLCPSEVA